MSENELIIWLQEWYASQCNGEWEHGYGIHIDTIDNPGWRVKINLKNTSLENNNIPLKNLERNEDDWVQIWVKDSVFQAAGGAKNLFEILTIFQRWVNEGIIL
jgi:hypothetical protein